MTIEEALRYMTNKPADFEFIISFPLPNGDHEVVKTNLLDYSLASIKVGLEGLQKLSSDILK